MRDIWEENRSELDLMEQESYDDAVQDIYIEPVETAFDLNQREQTIVSDAMVRLDQARLYEMLIKHDMFDGIDANQHALENVKREIKGFIVERLEFLLGIRVEQKQESVDNTDSFFTDQEKQFLKMLAQRSVQKLEGDRVPEPKPIISKPAPKPQGLKTLAVQPKQSPSQLAPRQAPTQKVESKPIPQKTSNKPRTSVPSSSSKSIDEIAKEDLRISKGRKKAHEMTEDELMRENEKISKRYQKAPPPPNAIPVPDDSQLHNIYMTKELNKTSGRNNGTEESLNLTIAQALLRNK